MHKPYEIAVFNCTHHKLLGRPIWNGQLKWWKKVNQKMNTIFAIDLQWAWVNIDGDYFVACGHRLWFTAWPLANFMPFSMLSKLIISCFNKTNCRHYFSITFCVKRISFQSCWNSRCVRWMGTVTTVSTNALDYTKLPRFLARIPSIIIQIDWLPSLHFGFNCMAVLHFSNGM